MFTFLSFSPVLPLLVMLVLLLVVTVAVIQVADDTPIWFHRFLAFPAQPGDFNLTQSFRNQSVTTRMKAFQGDRKPIFYDVGMQRARHLHIPSDPKHRILQHHYGKIPLISRLA